MKQTITLVLMPVCVAIAAASFACSSASSGSGNLFTGGAGGTPGGAATGGTNAGGSAAGGTGGGLVLDGGGATGGGSTNCSSGPTEDKDQDGFTKQDGDCNDCDANANPGAYDVAGNQVDEDCNGTPDDTSTDCDGAIASVGDADPMNGARAIGLCHAASAGDKKWGVLEAKWVMADGTTGMNDLGHGFLPGFGPNVHCQEGKRMLGLSSGTAREPTDADYADVGGEDMLTSSAPPTGFPVDSPTCPGNNTTGTTANDPAGLELKIRVPTNAKSFSYNFNFYTYEWPDFVCSSYNDSFVAILSPAPPTAKLGNISFDVQGNPVSVNNGFLEACGCYAGPPCDAGGKTFSCPLGTSLLQGTGFGMDTTGFDDHGSTGWLETKAPVTPGSEITIRFSIWDAGDHVLDSTVLVDNWKFSAEEATGTVTNPVPTPK
ncbi:MAG: choice-of-anchor L domain-containing protein [Polyangiaceae bacterium]